MNRNRPSAERLDLIWYSINPQVHAFDNSSLTETLEAQAITVESAQQVSAGLLLAVTPITFLPRFNPNAAAPESDPKAGELPAQVAIKDEKETGSTVKCRTGHSRSHILAAEFTYFRGCVLLTLAR